jgi:hypothetical protein
MRFHVKQPDLVEQLRFMEKVAIGPFGATAGNAADELERLRAALEDAIAWHEAERGNESGESPRIDSWRAALKDTTP